MKFNEVNEGNDSAEVIYNDDGITQTAFTHMQFYKAVFNKCEINMLLIEYSV